HMRQCQGGSSRGKAEWSSRRRIGTQPWAMDYLKEDGHIVDTEMNYRNKDENFFDTEQPLHIEVGTGMGTFITELAARNPDINFLGIELDKNIIIRVVE